MKKILCIFIVLLGMTLSLIKVSANEVQNSNENESLFSMKNYFQNLYENSPDNSRGSCAYVSLIQCLSYYDTFYNDNIIPESYEVNEISQSYSECVENSPGVLRRMMLGDVIEDIENNKHIDYQSKLMDIFYSNILDGDGSITTISFVAYNSILDYLFPNNNVFVERLTYNDYFYDKSYDDPQVKDWCESYIKTQLDLGKPVIVGLKYTNNENGDLENHAVVAYYYDEEGIHANFGWSEEYNDVVLNEYSIFEMVVLDVSDLPEVHSNNYKIIDDEYCGCGYKTHTHTYPEDWTSISDITHSKECTNCNYIKTEEHNKNIEGEYIKCDNCIWEKSIINDFECENFPVNSFDYRDYIEYFIHFLDDSRTPDHVSKFEIKQTSTFKLMVRTNKLATLFIIKKDTYHNETELISKDTYDCNVDIEITLLEGTYYIGYYSCYEDNSVTLKLKKLVLTGEGDHFITDPSNLWLCGSQITVAESIYTDDERTYNQNTILEGFTRIIYLSSGTSRQDYYWYSSNENIATVSAFGTVLGKSVDENTTIKIMAINKFNPKIIYIEEFTVLNDTLTYENNPIEINVTMTMSINEEKNIDLSNINVPINILQNYQWISSNYEKITVSYFGLLKCNSCEVGDIIEVTGSYRYNNRVKVILLITIIE